MGGLVCRKCGADHALHGGKCKPEARAIEQEEARSGLAAFVHAPAKEREKIGKKIVAGAIKRQVETLERTKATKHGVYKDVGARLAYRAKWQREYRAKRAAARAAVKAPKA